MVKRFIFSLVLLGVNMVCSAQMTTATPVIEMEKQCQINDANACKMLAYEYFLEDGRKPKDLPTAIYYFDKACELKEGQSCSEIGVIYSDGRKVPQNYELAKLFFKKSCDAGVTDNCDYEEVGTPTYIEKRSKHLAMMDYLNGGEAYYNLGMYALEQYKFPQAKEVFEKSCSQNYQPSCDMLKNNENLK